MTCPLERCIAAALTDAGIAFHTEAKRGHPYLDFYLPEFDVYIEVKAAHSKRTAGQLARADNVILAQGERAVALLASLIKRSK